MILKTFSLATLVLQQFLRVADHELKVEETMTHSNVVQLLHLSVAQLEVEKGEVLPDPLLVGAFLDDDDLVLDQVAEKDLRRRLVLLLGKGEHLRVHQRFGSFGPSNSRNNGVEAPWRSNRRIDC